jgi:HK97 family phage major capsid protein
LALEERKTVEANSTIARGWRTLARNQGPEGTVSERKGANHFNHFKKKFIMDEDTVIQAVQEATKSIDLLNKRHKSEMDRMKTQMQELSEDVARNKDSGGSTSVRKPLVDKSEVQDFIAKTFLSDGSKSRDAARFKINSGHVFKAAETMTGENFFSGGVNTTPDVFTGRAIDTRLYQRSRKSNLILDYYPIETVTSPTLYYMSKEEVSGSDASSEDTGGAQWIESAGQKPGRSFRVSSEKAEAKKLAIFGTISDKLLRDVASLESWVREDFMLELKEAFNDALLNSDGTGLSPLGLLENAVSFSVTPAFATAIEEPNLIDVIAAMAASMAEAKENPWRAFISKDNFFKIHVLKDSQARYHANTNVFIDNFGRLYIAGVEVIGVDSEDIDATHVLMIGQDPGFKIKIYQNVVFERGLNGEDFRYDRTSYRSYQECLSYIPAHRYNSVQYDTISSVLSAIEFTS